MADKSRNFRSSYYDKVGFRGVEEKKSLEILINERPIDKDKLSKFCLRFTLPVIYREYVWKVILGVISVNSENDQLLMVERQHHYEDLENSLRVMRAISDDTPRDIRHTLMYLVTEEFLDFDLKQQLQSTKAENLTALASLFLCLSSTDVVAFWTFRNFLKHHKKFSCQFKTMIENFETILKKEDEILYSHLKSNKILNILPYELWFKCYFAQVLHELSLARVFDKIIGGSCKILPYVGTALLIVKRRCLMAASEPDKIIEILLQNPEDISDVVVNKALDLAG